MEIGVDVTEWWKKWFEELVAGAVGLGHGGVTPEIVFGGDGLIEGWYGGGQGLELNQARQAKRCKDSNPFELLGETFKTVESSSSRATTPLKRGVNNERDLRWKL